MMVRKTTTDECIYFLVGKRLEELRPPTYRGEKIYEEMLCIAYDDRSVLPLLSKVTDVVEFEGVSWNEIQLTEDDLVFANTSNDNIQPATLTTSYSDMDQNLALAVVSKAYTIMSSASRLTTDSFNAAFMAHQIGTPVIVVGATDGDVHRRFTQAAFDPGRANFVSSLPQMWAALAVPYKLS